MVVTLNTDANRLMQVFSNLISNALKHTSKGSITYGYRLISDGQEVEFFVSGLGLPLSKIIVEKLGGNISVSSTLGEGSTFRFVLPFEGTIGGVSRNSRVTTNSRTIRVSTRTDVQNAPLILVAEDEDNNFELVKVVLSKRYRLIRTSKLNPDGYPYAGYERTGCYTYHQGGQS